ncbi:MAG: hypothetical protein AUG49_24905 [Catenulispora sp. 13_1_20CM_3_70_7]|nr:MAG: hypothetical protein AUG49_24905 [Catenulispora sp. 13_1_20CM_3_70_7]
MSPPAHVWAACAEPKCSSRTITWYFPSAVWYRRVAASLKPKVFSPLRTSELFEYSAATASFVSTSPSAEPITDASGGTAIRKYRMSPLCTPLATFPVTVEDGFGDGLLELELELEDEGGEGEEDGDEDDRGDGDHEPVAVTVTRAAAAEASAPCDEPSRPRATTPPAVPPATTTHPAANATTARRRPAPGIPTPGTCTHP